MIWFYRILFPPALLLALPYYGWRMIRRGGYAKDFAHRLGFVKKLPACPLGKKRVWIQAVSVGEIGAASTLIKKLSQRSDIELVVTTTTSTAYKILREKFAKDCFWCGVFPIDFFPFSRMAHRRIRPNLCVLMEGELWPEHMHQARVRGAKILLVNARLSDRSYARYSKVKFLAKRLFGKLSAIMASSKEDAQRFISLGANPENVSVSGNMKFDSAPEKILSAEERAELKKSLGFAKNSLVMLGSSTWPTEEEMLLKALKDIREKFPQTDCRLLLVPRHAERRAEIIELLEKSGLSYCVRTQNRIAPEGTLVYLADTTGELSALTQCADFAFIGKSLDPNDGGQTPIECAALGVAISYGNNMSNFRPACKALEKLGASLKAQTHDEAVENLERLASDSSLRKEISNRAKLWHDSNSGSSERIFENILSELKS